jgi:hypothetical protein
MILRAQLAGDASNVAQRTLESRDFASSSTGAALDAVGALCAAVRSHSADLAALSAVARSASSGGSEGVAHAVRDLHADLRARGLRVSRKRSEPGDLCESWRLCVKSGV